MKTVIVEIARLDTGINPEWDQFIQRALKIIEWNSVDVDYTGVVLWNKHELFRVVAYSPEGAVKSIKDKLTALKGVYPAFRILMSATTLEVLGESACILETPT